MKAERRACRRFAVPGAAVDWRSEPAGKDYGSDARVGDLSRGGLRFIGPGPPRPGAALSLILRVPGARAVELRGRVAWSSVSSGQIHAVGVEFAPYGAGSHLNTQDVLDWLIAVERRFLDDAAE